MHMFTILSLYNLRVFFFPRNINKIPYNLQMLLIFFLNIKLFFICEKMSKHKLGFYNTVTDTIEMENAAFY